MGLFTHGYGHDVWEGGVSNPGRGTIVGGVFHPTRLLYMSLNAEKELNFTLNNLETCIADIRLCMTEHVLRLNDDKTIIIYLASLHCVRSLKIPPLQIIPKGLVKHLVVIGYSCINIYEHAISVCGAAYYHLKNIHCLKVVLKQEVL